LQSRTTRGRRRSRQQRQVLRQWLEVSTDQPHDGRRATWMSVVVERGFCHARAPMLAAQASAETNWPAGWRSSRCPEWISEAVGQGLAGWSNRADRFAAGLDAGPACCQPDVKTPTRAGDRWSFVITLIGHAHHRICAHRSHGGLPRDTLMFTSEVASPTSRAIECRRQKARRHLLPS
jgi:hypothetical protein